MDDFIVLDDSDSRGTGPGINSFDDYDNLQGHSEGIWLSIAKIIWGKDYIPLDEHDRVSFNIILTMCMLIIMIIIVGVYIFVNRRKPANKQRYRVQRILKKEKLTMNGVNHKQKKTE